VSAEPGGHTSCFLTDSRDTSTLYICLEHNVTVAAVADADADADDDDDKMSG